MYDSTHVSYMGETINQQHSHSHSRRNSKGVYLDGATYYSKYSANLTRVAPAIDPSKVFEDSEKEVIFDTMKPLILITRLMGIFPVGQVQKGLYKVTPVLLGYSLFVLSLVSAYIGYIKWDKVKIIKSAEGRFEEAVIDYLFTVYLVPVLLIPICWYESVRMAAIFTDWAIFESFYKKVSNKRIPLFQGNKPLLITLAMPILASGTMVVTHVTMVYFRFLQVVPYCYVNTVTYLVGGIWYLHSDVIGRVATLIADDFETALHNVGPSNMVAEYRSMWMLLAKITRDVGNASCYQLTFLCMYLFMIITLTIYGLLSQIQDGLGTKDIGLTVTALFAIGLLYFICDEAHYASNCVRVYFQKKLLLVELSWMSDDAQQEIQMFLRATEMNQTDMSLGGFFDVSRNLFKSLLATMVTYLVVLLQFQISIPEDVSTGFENTNSTEYAIVTATST